MSSMMSFVAANHAHAHPNMMPKKSEVFEDKAYAEAVEDYKKYFPIDAAIDTEITPSRYSSALTHGQRLASFNKDTLAEFVSVRGGTKEAEQWLLIDIARKSEREEILGLELPILGDEDRRLDGWGFGRKQQRLISLVFMSVVRRAAVLTKAIRVQKYDETFRRFDELRAQLNLKQPESCGQIWEDDFVLIHYQTSVFEASMLAHLAPDMKLENEAYAIIHEYLRIHGPTSIVGLTPDEETSAGSPSEVDENSTTTDYREHKVRSGCLASTSDSDSAILAKVAESGEASEADRFNWDCI